MSKSAATTSSNADSIASDQLLLETSRYNWDPEDVGGFYKLVHRMEYATTIDDWSWILADYTVRGNNKIATNVRIFNMNSGTDCPNAHSENCQVGDACYAMKSENMYDDALAFRRRQEYLWDTLDPDTFAKAFIAILDRARSETVALRLNQAGDMRDKHDVLKAERIAELLDEHDVQVYTYSASDYIDFSDTDYLTVNMSNARRPGFGDKHYTAVPRGVDVADVDHLDESAVQCPYDKSDGQDQYKCGECQLCFQSNGPDVYIRIH